MSRMKPILRGLCVAALLGTTAAAQAQSTQAQTTPPAAPPKSGKPPAKAAPKPLPMILEPRAVDLLKAMSARLAAAQGMSFTATVGMEYPSRFGPPLVYSSRYDVTMQRPDKLRVVRLGDGPASEFYYDGKTMTAYAPAENLAAVADAPPTIDAALKKAFETAAIYFPFTDLLLPDPAAPLLEGGKLAFVIGQSIAVGGVRTDVIAFADKDVFAQIWIGADDRLPRRIRAEFRNDPRRLRHDMELSNWQVDTAPAADAFMSSKAKAATPINFAHPAAALASAKPPAKGKPAAAPAAKPAMKTP